MKKVANPIRKADKMADKLCNSLRTWWGAENINVEHFGAYYIIIADIRGGNKALLFADGYTGKASRDMSYYTDDTYNHMRNLGTTYQKRDTLINQLTA